MSDQERVDIQKNIADAVKETGGVTGGVISADPFAKLLVQLLSDVNRMADALTMLAKAYGSGT